MQNDDRLWSVKQIEHEGFPLLLRYPNHRDREIGGRFPILAVVIHILSKVRADGLPEPDYNDQLIDFDSTLRDTLERDGGYVVLVETFAGKRKYYAYLASNLGVEEKIRRMGERYPQETLTFSVHSDPGWTFIKNYHDRYLKV
jgi:hypothetical protein